MQQMDEQRLCKAAFQEDMIAGLGWVQGLKHKLRQCKIQLFKNHTDFDMITTSRDLQDQFTFEIMTANASSNPQRTYYSLKAEFRQEPYITQAKIQHVWRTLARFRTGCHWLQVCIGRRHQVEHDERWCPSCTNCADDKMHAIFHCRSYAMQRSLFSDL